MQFVFFGRIQGEERSIWVEDVYTCIDTHACGVASQCGSEIGPWIRATVKIHTHLAIHPEGLEKDHRRLNPKDKKQDLHKQHTYSLWIFLTHAETIKFFFVASGICLALGRHQFFWTVQSDAGFNTYTPSFVSRPPWQFHDARKKSSSF